ncbi:MAG: SRPBCC domain-containing protein [Ignavibacteriae bacterium]|nr:SRPBCC domain-containing protein [Ignavibacteriota bacterium]
MPSQVTKLFMKRTIPESREKVFRAWTDPQEIKKWFAPGPAHVPEVSVDLRIGGSYRIHMRDDALNASYFAIGTYREIKPPHRLVFTWSWEGDPKSMEMLVTIELREKAGTTELSLTHEYFPSEESKKKHEEGWVGCLDKLEQSLHLTS